MAEEDYLLSSKDIVINNGSQYSKVGYVGEDQPRFLFPTLIGFPKYTNIMTDVEFPKQGYYLGDEAMQLRGVLKLNYPIEHGIINDWNGIEKIWYEIFYNILNVDISIHRVLLTEPSLNPKLNRERMAEIMFETFNVPALYIANQDNLSLYASGRTTGVIVSLGAQVSHVVPIHEGLPLAHAIRRIDVAGNDITMYLQRLVRQRGYTFNGGNIREIFQDIKEKLCYVALDPEKEIILAKKSDDIEKIYIFPDGESINVGVERFLAPECLISPFVIGKSLENLDDTIVWAISSCDKDIRKELYENIVLSGGSSMFPGLKERLIIEIKEQILESIKVNIIAPPERMFSEFLGGSIFCSLLRSPQKDGKNSKEKLWVTRREYKELGVQAVHRCV